MKNYSTTKKYAKGPAIIRYEDEKFLCPKGHEVSRVDNEFICRKCSEVYRIN